MQYRFFQQAVALSLLSRYKHHKSLLYPCYRTINGRYCATSNVRPERKRALYALPLFISSQRLVCTFMLHSPLQRKDILIKYLLEMNQRTLPWAICVGFYSRNHNAIIVIIIRNSFTCKGPFTYKKIATPFR